MIRNSYFSPIWMKIAFMASFLMTQIKAILQKRTYNMLSVKAAKSFVVKRHELA